MLKEMERKIMVELRRMYDFWWQYAEKYGVDNEDAQDRGSRLLGALRMARVISGMDITLDDIREFKED